MGESTSCRRRPENIKNKGFLLLTILVLMVLAGALVAYYITSYRNTSAYINSIYTEKQKIDRANASIADTFKNFEQIDIKNTEEISKAIKSLSASQTLIHESLKNIQAISPLPKYKDQYDKYTNGIDNNKKIYTQAILILENPTHKDIDNAVEALYKYVSESSRFYEESKLGKTYIPLPSGLLTLPDKIASYVKLQKNDYEAKSRILEQYTSYFNEMNKIVSSFKDSKVDLNSHMELIHSNKTTLENVYLNIEKKLMLLSDINTSLNKVSIPPKFLKEHEKLSSIINGYMDYCQEFKNAVIEFEEAGSDNNMLNEANKLFDDINKQYKSLSSSFEEYLNQYNQDKNSYGDADNV